MDRDEMRLELLKLTYKTHVTGGDSVQAVAEAQKLEEYIFKPSETEAKPVPAEPPPKAQPAAPVAQKGDLRAKKKSDNSIF